MVCSCIAQNVPWIAGVLSNDIAAILPCTALYVQPKCSHTLNFNIQEFQVSFSPLYCTVSKCILHGKSAYSVHTVCSYIAQNARWITGLLSNNIAAILPCTTLYLQPKYSRTVCFQYTRVSNCFFNTTLYCKTAYYTWEKWVHCAYGMVLHCTECALNHGCFIRRYRRNPAM